MIAVTDGASTVTHRYIRGFGDNAVLAERRRRLPDVSWLIRYISEDLNSHAIVGDGLGRSGCKTIREL